MCNKVVTDLRLALLIVKWAKKRKLMSGNLVMDLGGRVLIHFSADFLKVIGNARHRITSVAPNRYMHDQKAFRRSWGSFR